jgi:hypothetical protein
MKNKKRAGKELSGQESELINRLRRHPEIMERVQKILEIAEDTGGPLKTADQIEELLIEEMRRLGGATLQEWATEAEERVGRELKAQDPNVLKRK